MIRKKHLLSAVFLIQAVLFAETIDFQDAMPRQLRRQFRDDLITVSDCRSEGRWIPYYLIVCNSMRAAWGSREFSRCFSPHGNPRRTGFRSGSIYLIVFVLLSFRR